ncbi:MAG: hypothetical protein E7667_01305 [Ruminococcaceae bacterium]|nr:hypothetical protein [Oscillospiraceae bacterium]
MGLIFTDIPELEGSKSEIVLSNLGELENKFAFMIEKRLFHLSELADAIVCDGEDFDIIKSILLSIQSDGIADCDDIIDENRREADLVYSGMSLSERLIVYSHLSKKISADCKNAIYTGRSVIESSVVQDFADTIAYVKNSYNDEAYLKLSSAIKSPRAVYYDSAEDACRAVYDHECEYCILAVEASGVKLSSFYGQIIKYGFLKIAEHQIKTRDGYTSYSLLCNGNIKRDKISRGKFAEIIIDVKDVSSLSDIMTAFKFCLIDVKRIDTINGSICLTLKIDKADLETFVTYCAIECPHIHWLGIYKQI